jgi:hypothetical protein
MDVVGHAANAIGFAARVSDDCGKVRVQFRPGLIPQTRETILCAEDHVNDNETQGLRHAMGRAFSPCWVEDDIPLGRRPRLAWDRAFGAQVKRKVATPFVSPQLAGDFRIFPLALPRHKKAEIRFDTPRSVATLRARFLETERPILA